MTTVSSKYKDKTGKSKIGLTGQEIIMAVLHTMAGFFSARAQWCDIALPVLSIVLLHTGKDILYKYSLLAGALFSCTILAAKDTAYIPIFLALVVYLAVEKTFKTTKYSIVSSLVIMAVSDIVLLYHYMPLYYKLLAVAKAVAVYIISNTLAADDGILTNTKQIHTFTDSAIKLLSLLCWVLALSGGDSHWIYTGFAMALSVGWHCISQGRLTTAFIALVSMAVSAVDKKGFIPLLLSGAILWLAGSFFAEKLSLAIYPAIIISSFVCNILFISSLNSFALVGSGILALIIYFFTPYLVRFPKLATLPDLASGRDWRLLMLSLKKLENTLSFLASCVIDISRLNEKKRHSSSLEDIVAEDVCRKCDKNMICWQQKYSFTHQQFTEYAQKMYWQEENRFSSAFSSQCIKTGELVKSFEENARLLLSKKYILQSQKNNQKLLQKAFVSLSSVVGDIIYQNQHSHLLNTSVTMETSRFLKDMGIGHTYCLCSQNPDQMSFAVYELLDDKMLYKIKCHIEKLYGTKFLDRYCEKQGTEWLYVFMARPLFSYETAIETSRYKKVNGDSWEIFAYNGMLYVLLSDGMGTGNLAAAESQTVIAMAKSLITTGVSMNTIVDLINLSMNLKSNGETSASLDMLCADLFSGNCTITKAGAGVSMVIDKNGVSRYYSDSLPLGIVKEVKAVQCQFTVKAGDTILLMSDGVGVVTQDIKDMYGESCTALAQKISGQNTVKDDKTVIAVKLKLAQ